MLRFCSKRWYTTVSSDEVSTLLRNLSIKPTMETASRFESLVEELDDASERSRLCDQVLGKLRPTTKDSMLITTLNHLRVEDTSLASILNLLHIMTTLGQSNVKNLKEAKYITQFLSKYCDSNINLVRTLERLVDESLTPLSANTLIIMYIRTGDLSKALRFLLRISQQNLRIRDSTVEMLMMHCSYKGDFHSVRIVKEIADFFNYEIYPRTWSVVYSCAIEQGEIAYCRERLGHMLCYTFIENGTIVALAELLERHASIGEMGSILKTARRKSSLTPELHGRLRRTMVESFALRDGFRNSWKFLSQSHEKGMLEVTDYPNLLNKFQLTLREGQADALLIKMQSNDPVELKCFYLSLAIAKSVEVDRLENIITILITNPRLKRHLNEESIWQLICGLKRSGDNHQLDMVLTLLLSSHLKLWKPKTVNQLLKLVLESQYWFKAFEVIKIIRIPNYKFDEQVASKIKSLCLDNNLDLKTIEMYM